MPTIFTHPAPILALGLGLGRARLSWRLLLAGVIMSVVPDLDVIGFKLGVRYADLLGHRGFSHSLAFALTSGLLGALLAPWLKAGRLGAFMVFFLAVALHIALDAATSGGLGVAVFWPLSEDRYFLPWRPIRVSPLNPTAFLSERGLTVLISEFLWVWLPCIMLATALRLLTRQNAGRTCGGGIKLSNQAGGADEGQLCARYCKE